MPDRTRNGPAVNGAGSGNSFKAGGLLGPTLPAGTATARIHEPSAWLRGAAARRVRQIEAQLKDIDTSTYGVVVAPLGRTGVPGSREDRRCDRCRVDVPPGDLLHMFFHRPTPLIFLAGGLCSSCARKEGA